MNNTLFIFLMLLLLEKTIYNQKTEEILNILHLMFLFQLIYLSILSFTNSSNRPGACFITQKHLSFSITAQALIFNFKEYCTTNNCPGRLLDSGALIKLLLNLDRGSR